MTKADIIYKEMQDSGEFWTSEDVAKRLNISLNSAISVLGRVQYLAGPLSEVEKFGTVKKLKVLKKIKFSDETKKKRKALFGGNRYSQNKIVCL